MCITRSTLTLCCYFFLISQCKSFGSQHSFAVHQRLSSNEGILGKKCWTRMNKFAKLHGNKKIITSFFSSVDDNEGNENQEDEDEAFLAFDDHIPKLNSVTLVGRAGSDPMARYFDSGKVVATVSLAVKKEYHPLERQVKEIPYGQEETDWFNLEFWDKTAEAVVKLVEKGTRIGVTGSLAIDKWTDKQTGEARSRGKICCRTFELLESKAEKEARRQNKGGYSKDPNSFGGSRDGAGSSNDNDRDVSSDLPSFFDSF